MALAKHYRNKIRYNALCILSNLVIQSLSKVFDKPSTADLIISRTCSAIGSLIALYCPPPTKVHYYIYKFG